jgi:hypothetical protein
MSFAMTLLLSGKSHAKGKTQVGAFLEYDKDSVLRVCSSPTPSHFLFNDTT